MKNKIKYFRKAILDVSQDELAKAVGCTKTKISKLETGSQELTQTWMRRIAETFSKDFGLKIAPSDLLPDTDKPDQGRVTNLLSKLNDRSIAELERLAQYEYDKNKNTK